MRKILAIVATGALALTMTGCGRTALNAEHLWDFAEMTRTELVMIDADTRPRRFLQELRWNQAYYRLAQGF